MKNALFLFRKYLHYLLSAKNQHGIHSPFVFNLYNDVIRSNGKYYAFGKIEAIRAKMLLRQDSIDVHDLGAGSNFTNTKKRKVSEIAKRAAKSQKFGELLFRLVNHFQPKQIVELGTSLGISTLYLHFGHTSASVISLEGCPETAALASENFRKVDGKNIQLIVGNFDNTFPELLKKERPDFIFFDGNHKKEPTIRYFEEALLTANENSIFVFDDIHWSEEMHDAWNYILNHAKVKVSIDLFFVGIVFFKNDQHKENFVLRF